MKKTVLLTLILMLCTVLSLPTFLGLSAHPKNLPAPISNFKESNGTIYVKVLDSSSLKSEYVDLEKYLPGVLAAEMPASFEVEALKAQAVAARSYILSKLNAESKEHPDAAVCNNPDHCKAHITEKEAKSRWKKDEANAFWKKITGAVSATQGEYMVCEDEVVEAFFFAQSGGRTENSEDVWGESRPYLKSVESVEDMLSESFYSTVTVPFSEFCSKLNLQNTSTSATPIIGNISHTQGGSVNSIVIDGKTFKGTHIRKVFGLRSACFDISLSDSSVVFNVKGYGHGVGMSQSGANLMAKNGEKYTEILSHYYTNIQIMKL